MPNINAKRFVEEGLRELSHKPSMLSSRTMINYAERIYQSIVSTGVVSKADGLMYVDEAIEIFTTKLKLVDRVFLIGNGGSSAACDHMANDLCLAGVRAQSLTNANNITCIANDFGFSKVFTKQLEWMRDSASSKMLVAFSCSGKSDNILDAVKWAKQLNYSVVTFSGFQPDNPLAAAGDLNFHVPSNSYGVVQIAHEALIHCAIDKLAGIY